MIDEIMKEISLVGLIVIVIACVAGTKIIRQIIETALPAWKKKADENHPDKTYATTMSRWWNKVILYILPVAIGACMGFVNSDFIFGNIQSQSGKIFYGASLGWMSGFIVKIFFQLIQKKTGVDISKVVDIDPTKGKKEKEEKKEEDDDSKSDDQDKEEA